MPQTKPWLLLAEGELTGTSSIMPQKRNPSGLVFLRAQASIVIGHAQTFLLVAHNVASGMSDYKPFINSKQGNQPNNVMRELADLFDGFGALLHTLVFDEQRALAEVNADYSTTTELADTLQRDADVPFRVGHHFASELVNFGRANGLKPADIPYAEAQRIYANAAAAFKLDEPAAAAQRNRFPPRPHRREHGGGEQRAGRAAARRGRAHAFRRAKPVARRPRMARARREVGSTTLPAGSTPRSPALRRGNRTSIDAVALEMRASMSKVLMELGFSRARLTIDALSGGDGIYGVAAFRNVERIASWPISRRSRPPSAAR